MIKRKYKEHFPINDTELLSQTIFKDIENIEKKRWRNFINISKSKYILELLAKKQSNICPVCDELIIENKPVIHHLDYNNLCVTSKRIKINSPTKTYPNRQIPIPNCENCNYQENCLNKIVLLHNRCHFVLHIIEGRIKKPKKKKNDEKIILKKEDIISHWKSVLTTEHRYIIQTSINILRKLNPEKKYSIKYNTKYIVVKPYHILIFKLRDTKLSIRIKYGDILNMKDQLYEIGIQPEINLKKGEPYTLSFSINKNQFDENIKLITDLYKMTTRNN